MREIFADHAVSRVTQAISATDLTIAVVDTTNFPKPKIGEEYFKIVLAGVCNNNVEIARAIEICGDGCIRLSERGIDGTTAHAFAPGDMVYSTISAESVQAFMDRYYWYLGPFDTPPTTDNEGFPLQDGHTYFDTTLNTMFVWSDGAWQPFNPTIGATIVETFTWVPQTTHPGGTALPWPDIYSRVPGDWEQNTHGIYLYLNGNLLTEEIDDQVLLGDYTVSYDPEEITPKNDIAANDVVIAKVLLRTDVANAGFIERTETDASGYGFVTGDSPIVNDPQKLPLASVVYTEVWGRMRWRGNWASQQYEPNDMVIDGNFTAVCNTQTTDRPAPIAQGASAYGYPAASWTKQAPSGLEAKISNIYTLNTSGWIELVKLAAMTEANVDEYIVSIWDNTSPGSPTLLYTRAPITIIQDNEVELDIPDVFVPAGMPIKVELTLKHATAVEYSSEAGIWGTLPAWASAVEGEVILDTVDQSIPLTTAVGIDIRLQPSTDASSDWDLLPSSGGGGGGGGDGTTHFFSNVAPNDSQGADGDIWMVAE